MWTQVHEVLREAEPWRRAQRRREQDEREQAEREQAEMDE
jgi:hypothetical protein